MNDVYISRIRFDWRETGLSLVELMVALTVGVILLAGVVSVFLSSRQSYGINNAVAQVQESGRFALHFLQNDTRMAGYMGCTRSVSTNSILNGGGVPFDFSNGIVGYNYNGTGPSGSYTIAAENPAPVSSGNYSSWTSGPPGASTPLDTSLPPPIAGSDVLVVRHTVGDPATVTKMPGGGQSANLFVSSVTGINIGAILVITNCVQATAFQATNVNSQNQLIVHATKGTPGNQPSAKLSDAYANGGQVVNVDTVVYYISQGADGSPSLFSADIAPVSGAVNGFSNAKELVSGIESMQILYGVDTTGSGAVSQYVTADQVPDWQSVVSVEIGLLVRSATGAVPQPATVPTYNVLGTTVTAPLDTRYRRVFITTIGLRNRLP